MWRVCRRFLLCLLLPTCVYAHGNAASVPHADLVNQLHSEFGLETSGYVETSYNYLLRSNQFISQAYDREYDIEENGFTLQQAAIKLVKHPEVGMGGEAVLLVGRDANEIAPYGWNAYYGSQTIGFVLPRAFLSYDYHALEIDAGILESMAGQESYNPTLDTNFSRSLLDQFAEPGALLGMRMIYNLSSAWQFNAGVNNGWGTIRDYSRQKTFELGFTYQPTAKWTLLLEGLSGEQRVVNHVSSGPTGRRSYVNIIATYTPISDLSLVVSYDYGIQTKALSSSATIGRVLWQGVSGYVNYNWNAHWQTSLRGEWYDDQNGYTTGVRQNLREATVTVGYMPIKHLLLRAETRHDFSNVNGFMNKSGVGVSNNQQSFALEGLYRF